MARCGFVVSLILLLSLVSFAQNLPKSDPQAVLFASQAILALTHGSSISDVRLTADVTWVADKPESGTGILMSKGTSESRLDLELSSGGIRTEIRNNLHGPAGKWTNPDGKSGKYAFHNCLTDAAWFFPAFSSLARTVDSHFVFAYFGEEIWNDVSAKHVRVSQVERAFKDRQRLSTMDFYLDPTTLLPLGVAFKTHPDNDMNAEIATEVRFSDYQLVSGVEVPFRIERVQNGAVLLDAKVSEVSFNTGLSNDSFVIH
jgi:hypothetical protein